MDRSIGIMQGRLSPPVRNSIQAFPLSCWRDEFAAARQAGLRQIEWIFDLEDLLNPLATEAGSTEMQHLMAASGVGVTSLCADYFMHEPLLLGSIRERKVREEKLAWLIARCSGTGLRHIILPFVDQSQIANEAQKDDLIRLMRSILPILAQHRMELHLETSLAPASLADLLHRIDSPWVRINYDTGNSASLGYDPGEEWKAYGKWVGSIHLKDRRKGGGTVPLGLGNVDLPRLSYLWSQSGYAGGFTLQAARGEPGDEIAWAKRNLKFVQDVFSQAS